MSELELRDAILRHALQLQRLSAGQEGEAEAILRELERELTLLLNSQTISEADKRAIQRIVAEAESAITAKFSAVAAVTDTHALAVVVADHTVQALEDVFPTTIATPTAARLASLTKDVLIDGAQSSAWWSKQAEDTAFKFAAQVRQGVLNGETNERIVQRVVGKQGEPGIMNVARRNARALVHSSIMNAANQARLATFRKNAGLLDGVRWLSTLDSHTCPQCAALDGQTWDLEGQPLGDTTVEFMVPPAHFSCFTGDTLVLSRGRITGASKRRFDGDVVVVKTASGREITCTPNHPILTDGGWIAAGLLDVGSNVICHSEGERRTGVDGNREDIPSRIHDVAEAIINAAPVRPVPMPVATPNFHGDGGGSEVAIVWSDSLLPSANDSAFFEHRDEISLIGRGLAGEIALAGRSHLAERVERFDMSFAGGVGGGDLGLALCSVHAAPFEPLGLGSPAPLDAVFAQDAVHDDALNPKLLSYGVARDPAHIDAAESLFVDDGARPNWYVLLLEMAKKDAVRDASLAADFSAIAPGDIQFDTVIDKRRIDYFGHVYNLETDNGWYIANGVISHNCRCIASPLPKSLADLGIQLPEGSRASSQGPVPASTTFSDFLKRQSPEFVDKVLGKARAEMFLAGRLTLKDLISGTGRELTLDQLGI